MDDDHPTAVEGSVRRHAGEPELSRGALIGRYVVLDRLGAGGMGVVYAAYDPELNRRVAIKLVRARVAGDEADVGGRMQREAQALARLSHPNVVAVYDVGTTDDRVFLAMELVDGDTLAAWCSSRRRTWRDVVAKFMEAGRGLAAAHAVGIVHRDFKPTNVLVGRDGRVRVLDFGLARAVGEPIRGDDSLASPTSGNVLSDDLTRTGSVLGTPVYMPPEAQRGAPVSAAGDQFSFCVALYEALYDERPFTALITSDSLPPVPPPPTDSRVPAWVRRVVLRGLAFAPSERFPSMEALLAALADDPAVKRRRVARAIGTVVAVGALVAGALVWRAHVRAERLADDPCAAAPRFDDTWGPAAREGVHAAFAATHTRDAEDVFAHTAAGFDDMTRAWFDARARACADTRDAHTQPEGVLLLRLACLDRVRDDLGALVALFLHADADEVKNATHAVHRVQGPVDCDDPHGLSLSATPPADLRPAVDALRARLVHAEALDEVNQRKAAVPLLKTIVADARALGYAPLVADTSLEYCTVVSSGNASQAAVACEDAELDALAAGLDGDGARAAVYSFEVAASLGSDAETTRRLRERARVWLARSHAISPLAMFEGSLGLVDLNAGRYESSIEHMRRAKELSTKVAGPVNNFVVEVRSTLVVTLTILGRFDEAIAEQQGLIPELERGYGSNSDLLASTLDNYGYNLAVLGRYDEARAALDRALGMTNAEEFTLGAAMCDSARVDIADGHVDRAIDRCEGGLAKLRALGITKLNLAINEDPLAAAYLAARRYDDALAISRSCLAEFVKDRGGDPRKDTVEMVPCLAIEGAALVELGRGGEAVAVLEHARELEAGHAAAPGVLANLAYQLARALIASGGDRGRATQLASDARDELARFPFAKARLAELDAWRAKALP